MKRKKLRHTLWEEGGKSPSAILNRRGEKRELLHLRFRRRVESRPGDKGRKEKDRKHPKKRDVKRIRHKKVSKLHVQRRGEQRKLLRPRKDGVKISRSETSTWYEERGKIVKECTNATSAPSERRGNSGALLVGRKEKKKEKR